MWKVRAKRVRAWCTRGVCAWFVHTYLVYVSVSVCECVLNVFTCVCVCVCVLCVCCVCVVCLLYCVARCV